MSGASRRFLGGAVLFFAAVPVPDSAHAASFSPATLVGPSHAPGCGAGGFLDLAGQCWKCPNGYAHDNILLPPTHDRVCRRGEQTRFRKGIKHAPAAVGCPAGQWPSLHDGFCYGCPAGYGHDALRTGDDPRVCFQKQSPQVSYRKGSRRGRTVLGLGCPAGQWPSLHNGYCYTCPDGYGHDIARNGDDARVCFKRTGGETLFRQGTRYDRSNVGVCPAGQWLSLHDTACYTCPAGYAHDVARTGDDGRVCFERREAFSAATRAGGLLCARGFFDPIDGGSCWSCPDSHGLRTVAPVNGERACTDRLDGIVAVDVCTPILNAVRDGKNGLAAVESTLQKIIGPALAPLRDALQGLTPQVQTPAELNALIDRLGERLRPFGETFEEVRRLDAELDRAGQGLRNLLLDPKVVCGGDAGEIDRRLAALGLRPRLDARERKAGWLGGWPVATVHAQAPERSNYATFFLALTVVPMKEPGLPTSPLNSLVVSVVTDFRGTVRSFLSIGRAFASNPSEGYSAGFMIFPSADIDDFPLIGNLGAEVSLNAGLARRLFSKFDGAKEGPGPFSFNVSFDPFMKSLPGIGASRDIYTVEPPRGEDPRVVDFGGFSIDFSVPLGGAGQ